MAVSLSQGSGYCAFMDMAGIVRFCEKHAFAERLKLSHTLVLKILLDTVRISLDAGDTPLKAAHDALLALDLEALTVTGEHDSPVRWIMPLEEELTAIITQMLETELPSIIIKDISPLKTFFFEKNIAKILNIPADEGCEEFINYIRYKLLHAHDAQRTAADTLNYMEGIAAMHAAKTKTYEYQLVGDLEDDLAEVISQTIGVPGRNRTGI